ncbi:MAG: hypothetical protein Q4F75_06900, partial [Pseudomonadota bacterium]|nr:hypothetical protein [Pseudomonadota bacterium]
MRISRVILMSTLSLIGLKVDLAYADIHLSVPVAGTHTRHTHNTLTLNHPLLPARLAAESSPRLAPFIESAMLRLCLPQAQSGNRHNIAPSLSRAGGRKNSPAENFSTTGESLLTGEQVTTMQRQCYKPSARSEVAELLSEAYEARRKNSPDFVRLEFSRGYESRKGQLGIITPLLTSPTLGEEYKEASVCFITDTGECSDNKFGNGEDLNN